MTERLFQRDSYLKTFDARVTAVRPEGVRLDRTAFFPTGGGDLRQTGPPAGAPPLAPVVPNLRGEGGVLPPLAPARPRPGPGPPRHPAEAPPHPPEHLPHA